MKYDFTTIVNRSGCGSSKWDAAKGASTEWVPLSVADMEFPTAPPIREALKRVADEYVLGYTRPTEAYYEAVCSWMRRRHDFEVKKEWIVNTPGVVNALAVLIDANTKPGESVLILTPVYYPFDITVVSKSRKIVYSRLKNHDGHYEIDFVDLERKAKRKDVTAILFCNPHNPVGRVWTKEELRRVADICCDNGVFIIDDEIHNDLIMPGYEHTVMANVSDKAKDNIAVCTAPSKTFNLAGLQCSNIIIPNGAARTKTQLCAMWNMDTSLNIFAYTACTAAYNECEEWLEELIGVVHENAELVVDFMAEHFPGVRVSPLEGTYLLWLDMRRLGLTHVEMRKMLEKHGIFLDNGEVFGIAGRGFQRINLACPKSTLVKALERFKEGMEEVYADWKEHGRPYHKTLKKGTRLEGFVYDSAYGTGRELSESTCGGKSTLLVFSRYYGCDIAVLMLKLMKVAAPVLEKAGCQVKFILQTDAEILREVQKEYSFELVADPKAKLYDRYNVFEAKDMLGLVVGDKLFDKLVGKDVKKLLHIKGFEKFAGSLMNSGASDILQSGARQMQLPAYVIVNDKMEVTYAHYSKTIADLPDTKSLIRGIRG